MFIWRAVATHPITGRQVASEWYDNELEAEAVRLQMAAEPDYDGYSIILERKAVTPA